MGTFFRVLILVLLAPIQVVANSAGKPFEDLQRQIDEIKRGAIFDPIHIDVDCNSGESLAAALTAESFDPRMLVIDVSGVCTELLDVRRPRVHLRGVSWDSAILVDQEDYAVRVDGPKELVISDLVIQGDFAAVIATRGASLQIVDSVLEKSQRGLLCASGSTCEVINSQIRENSQGFTIIGATTWVRASQVINNYAGINVFSNGTAGLTAYPYFSDNRTIVEDNTFGLSVFAGGNANLQSVDIVGNYFAGIYARQNSHVRFEQDAESLIENDLFDLYVRSNAGLSNVYNLNVRFGSSNPSIICDTGGYIEWGIPGQFEPVDIPDACYPN
jgi:hypothetical protein